MNIIGVYAPTEGNKTDNHNKELQETMNITGKADYTIIAGDLNARVGKVPIPEILGTNGEESRNNNRKDLIDFCSFNKIRITDTYFKHKDTHKYTWAARGIQSIIDYVIVNDRLKSQVLDTQVYRRPEVDTDHFLVQCDIRIPPRYVKRKRISDRKEAPKFKIQLLEQESIKTMYESRINEKLKDLTEDIEKDWHNLK
jgi:exonuclease III